jgi:sodium/bile acid cotransporter 7
MRPTTVCTVPYNSHTNERSATTTNTQKMASNEINVEDGAQISTDLKGLVTSDDKGDTVEETETKKTEDKPTGIGAVFACLCNFYAKNSFLVLLLLAILLAYAYPPLGADYLQPKITATWIAVIIIFLLSGIKLKSEELSKAFQRLRFNLFVQCYNFFVVSSVVFGFSRLMLHLGVLSKSLADGMCISTCVPITVNMVLVLTQSSNGDEAAAIFNAAFGNLTGVFLSPALILLYLGVIGDVNLGTVFYKLGLRVVLPIAVGQIFHKYSPAVVNFVKDNKSLMKKVQEYCLVFIVYTVFCKTFSEERDTSAWDAFIMIAFVFVLLTSMMGLAWFSLKLFFPNDPKLRVMGLFGCTHKSVAMGIPLINAIYEDDINVGFYTLPLLVWHPMQLIIGSFLAPRLSAFVKSEEERLGVKDTTESDV